MDKHIMVYTASHEVLLSIEKLRNKLGGAGLEYDEFFSVMHLDDFDAESLAKSVMSYAMGEIQKVWDEPTT